MDVRGPFAPLFCVIGERAFDLGNDFSWRDCDHTGIGFNDQAGVAFLLAGNHVVDDHWTPGGDRLLHSRAAGFPDEQMAFVQHPRKLVCPSNNVCGMAICRRLDCRPEVVSAAERYRKMDMKLYE